MSIAAAQATKFYEQVVAKGRLFTFTENDEYLVYRINDKEVASFWSSKTRLESIQKDHSKYQKFRISVIPLNQFLNKELQLFESEGLSIGVNWSGVRLTGHDISAQDLRENISYWQSKDGA
ncbi:DUF2750 domain-containing protein [Azohydromonas lata]|uniref:DUF2750 domain-containing protein n=1 Tax=Azohydromonas lata TaxID=45677 RepID=A0ABU5IJ51_9BURK|nr:DUF2750 domain-containing protein [Azohydromonas lata]MDZ5458658.1 DUF2750 domain-containing protein [Azohydromonas lata]